MLYLPEIIYNDYSIIDNNTIRGYHTVPIEGVEICFTDYYINSHYMKNNQCAIIDNITLVSNDLFTTNYFYRNDLSDILTISIVLIIALVYLPIHILTRIFKRGGVKWF